MLLALFIGGLLLLLSASMFSIGKFYGRKRALRGSWDVQEIPRTIVLPKEIEAPKMPQLILQPGEELHASCNGLWGKWGEPVAGKTVDGIDVLTQARKCLGCSIVQHQGVRVSVVGS